MSSKSFIAATVLLIFTGLSLTAQNQWETLNPKPSDNTGVKICFTSLDTGFIINNKQILKTTNCGQIWSISKEIESSNDIYFLKSFGYIVGNNGYVLKTTDKGLTWSPVSLGITDNLNSVFVLSPDTIIITSAHRFIKSVDGGNTWHSSDIPDYTINKTFFINSKTGHAACNSGIIIKTNNGGQSWYVTSVTHSLSKVIAISFVNKNTGFASCEFNDILKTTDGGEHWVNIANTSETIYSFSFTDEQNGFIAGVYGAVFKTTNGGSTWECLQTSRIYKNIFSLCFLNNNLGFAVGQRGVISKTTDAGMTWKQYSPTYLNILQLDFLSINTAYALAGNELLKTMDGGNTWQNTGAPQLTYKTSQFSFVNEYTGYCIAADGFVYKTTNGGTNWTKTNYGNGVKSNDLRSIFFADENTGFLSCGSDQYSVYKTEDGGNTWKIISDLAFVQMQFLNAQVGYGRTFNQMYRTTDGGKNWILSSYVIDHAITSLHFMDEKNGYLLGDVALLNTHDGGVTWNNVTIPSGYYDDVRFYSANVGYILDDNGILFKTTNGGKSWKNIFTDYGAKSVEFFGDNIYLSGDEGVILKSTIDIPPVDLLLNPASGISNNSVTLTGNVASNEGKIENIRFEYGVSEFDKGIPGVPDFVNPGLVSNNTATLEKLLPNTTYNYRMKASYNGQDYTTNTLQFKTLPDYVLTVTYVYYSTDGAQVYGQVNSLNGLITNIEFQYGTDTTFTSKINAIPGSAEEGNSTALNGNLVSLKADTKYYVRIKAVVNGTIRYSPIYYFITKKIYVFTLDTPIVSGTNVSFQATVIANKDLISNIVLEYGTSLHYGRKVDANPAVVANIDNVNAEVLNLNADSVYFYRLKGLMGSLNIYSEDNIISLKGSIIMISLKEEQKPNNSVLVSGLINSNAIYLKDIRFQYGLYPGSFTDSVNTNTYSISNNITNPINATINNLQPGKKYHFRLSGTAEAKRQYSDEIVFTMGSITGIELNKSDPDILIYPNPTRGYIYIKSPYEVTKSQIFNLSGQSLLIKKEKNFIDISTYPKGVYILKVFLRDKEITNKIIKY